eukprot:745817-Rhodomonas_salina.2
MRVPGYMCKVQPEQFTNSQALMGVALRCSADGTVMPLKAIQIQAVFTMRCAGVECTEFHAGCP